ncbi:MAG: von Willebrand factor type A domain-containing protein, partial [Gammaproteobacteria bacterium]|nr:von Willebrand factor type A domain-containing protein [Gammaproteobacteria bacterium]
MRYPILKTIAVTMTVFIIGCTQTGQQARQAEKTATQPSSIVLNDELVKQDTSKQSGPVIVPAEDRFRDSKHQAKKEWFVARQIAPAISMDQDAVANSPAFSISAGAYRLDSIRAASEPVNRENYTHYDDNAVKRVQEHPVSTFSIDVDTGSYANIRRMINTGRLPAHDAVRAEELINYFSYDYPVHAAKSAPFVLYKEIAVTPWNAHTHLLHIGIKAYDLPTDKLPPANLVFLVDVSGSMQSQNKLELLKSSLKLLTAQLSADDSVSIVVYAGASGVVLEPTAGDQKGKITAALEQLTAGGSTNGGAGIKLAYAMAEQAFIKGGINRVLLATDGDFNVGTVNIEQLKNLVEEKRKTGIALSTLGFGTGNYNDHLMEQIADIGNGNYAYIDTLNEAQKVLVDEMSSTMLTIARDVKLQIEFNPA